jgi:hypothetical protein
LLTETWSAPRDFADVAFWIVDEDSSGFVTVHEFDSEADYRAAMNQAEQAWTEFENGAA